MKKFTILVLAAVLLVAFTVPASAMEYVFGGYWRTRAYTNQNFTGDDSEMKDWTVVDTRTRLYFTAVLNENLKLVNKFEMDGTWGSHSAKGTGSYSDIGADGVNLEIKNSYADFNLGPVNAKVGIQGMAIARGFLFDDDFAGAVVSYSDDMMSLPLIWMKAHEGGEGHNRRDVDYYGIAPTFNLGAVTFNPFGVFAYSENARDWSPTSPYDDVKMYYAGANLDADMGMASVWLTGIYQGGEAELLGTDETVDFKAWLAAGGLGVNLGPVEVHGQAFYATGQDPDDEDNTAFFVPQGQSYYWSEIMGYGVFDNDVSNNAPADQIGNIMAANLGVTVSPVPELSISLDGWYAALAEDRWVGTGEDLSEENELGIEVDLRITYQLVKGLKLDVVGAYLFAGDVTTNKVANDENPYEVGTQLSLSF
jgi:hypothetical protein